MYGNEENPLGNITLSSHDPCLNIIFSGTIAKNSEKGRCFLGAATFETAKLIDYPSPTLQFNLHSFKLSELSDGSLAINPKVFFHIRSTHDSHYFVNPDVPLPQESLKELKQLELFYSNLFPGDLDVLKTGTKVSYRDGGRYIEQICELPPIKITPARYKNKTH